MPMRCDADRTRTDYLYSVRSLLLCSARLGSLIEWRGAARPVNSQLDTLANTLHELSCTALLCYSASANTLHTGRMHTRTHVHTLGSQLSEHCGSPGRDATRCDAPTADRTQQLNSIEVKWLRSAPTLQHCIQYSADTSTWRDQSDSTRREATRLDSRAEIDI